jgi:hypothetical protein
MIAWLLVLSAWAAPNVQPEDLACRSDRDCTEIVLGCACLHSLDCITPARDDVNLLFAINKKFQQKFVVKCTKEETRRCAMAGACAHQGAWIPRCHNHQCVSTYKKVNR